MEINFAQSDDDDEGIKLGQLWCGSNEAPEWLGLMIGRAPRSHAPLKPATASSRPVKANVLHGSDLIVIRHHVDLGPSLREDKSVRVGRLSWAAS